MPGSASCSRLWRACWCRRNMSRRLSSSSTPVICACFRTKSRPTRPRRPDLDHQLSREPGRIIASDSIKTPVVWSEGLDKDPEFGGEARNRVCRDFWPSGCRRAVRPIMMASSTPWRRWTGTSASAAVSAPSSSTSRDLARGRQGRPDRNALPRPISKTSQGSRRGCPARDRSLTSRLEELRNRLRTAEDKAERTRKPTTSSVVGAGRSMTEEQLALNNAQLVASRTRVTEARAKYDQIIATRPAGIEAGAIPRRSPPTP